MPKKIQLKKHLTSQQLEAHYKSAHDSTKRKQWRALHLISLGLTAAEAGRVVGVSRAWVSKTVKAYNAYGTMWPRRVQGERPVGRALDLSCAEFTIIVQQLLRAKKQVKKSGFRRELKIRISQLVRDLETETGIKRPYSTIARYTKHLAVLYRIPQLVEGEPMAPTRHQAQALNKLAARCMKEQYSEN